ncbi:MAG: hypothetical protein NNC22_01620 [Candidatus Nanosynbacter sp. P5B_S4_bin.39.1]|nr:hypothetical protein [Candidatus Nanosynbacter sp. P5B_S4_bin.39.1]
MIFFKQKAIMRLIKEIDLSNIGINKAPNNRKTSGRFCRTADHKLSDLPPANPLTK